MGWHPDMSGVVWADKKSLSCGVRPAGLACADILVRGCLWMSKIGEQSSSAGSLLVRKQHTFVGHRIYSSSLLPYRRYSLP